MSVSLEAVVAIVVNLVIIIVWAVRLEGKVRHLTMDFKECKLTRDKIMKNGKEVEHEFREKLDTLLAKISSIEGKLSVALASNKKGK